MTSIELAKQLVAAGWPNNRRLVMLASRYYRGLETRETLARYLKPIDVEFVIQSR